MKIVILLMLISTSALFSQNPFSLSGANITEYYSNSASSLIHPNGMYATRHIPDVANVWLNRPMIVQTGGLYVYDSDSGTIYHRSAPPAVTGTFIRSTETLENELLAEVSNLGQKAFST